MNTETGNPIAEKRRQRKLENQRLEAEARQRQEQLRLQKEREIKRKEDELLAAEQRRLREIEQLRASTEAELARIAGLEQAERATILGIERNLKLIGAFCTDEIELPPPLGVPLCSAVLLVSTLEQPVQSVEEDLLFIGDASSHIHVHKVKGRRRLFSIALSASAMGHAPPTSMCVTRSGRLVVCRLELHCIAAYDLSQVMTSYLAMSSGGRYLCTVGAASALVFSIGGERGSTNGLFDNPSSICVDETANELFVSDQLNHRVQVVSLNPAPAPALVSTASMQGRPNRAPISFSRAFGTKGNGRGQLHKPCGLDTSHYHVLVCDSGNHRVVAFTKRGAYVCSFGTRGSERCEFLEPRDVRLANVRKRALSRGLTSDGTAITNEQFDLIVADMGNFSVQILNESGEFVRALGMLAGPEQICFHRDLLSSHHSKLLEIYATLNASLPHLDGKHMTQFNELAQIIHPSCHSYVSITQHVAVIREDSTRFHHPLQMSYNPSQRELYVTDRMNSKVFVYNADGSRSVWSNLPDGENNRGISSVHSVVRTRVSGENGAGEERLIVSDPMSHRVAVLHYPSLEFVLFIGATTYGDQKLCSDGFQPGELRFPSYLATYQDGDPTSRMVLLVSDTGNHSVSTFDAHTGVFCGRIGSGFGHLDGFFDSPQGIAVFDNRWLYVCDQRNHRVQVFNLVSRQFSRAIGRQGSNPGELSFPTAVAVCDALPVVEKCNFGPHRDAKIVVGDAGNSRVQVFCMEDASVLFVVDASNTPFEQPMVPSGLVVEQRSGYFLVSDLNNRCVAIFRHDGGFVAAFGANLEPENRFQRPTGITIDRSPGKGEEQVLIVDAVRRAICMFDIRQ